jgi:TusA-related sulfurtransferase
VLALSGTGALAKKEPPADEDRTGKKELGMANCPSAVPGAVTQIANTREGVELSIVARDPAGRDEIRQRARKQAEVSWQTERGAMEHTGLGTGSGKYGFCPGMLQETTVEAMDLPDGALVIVRAQRPEQIAKVQRVTRDRVRALKKGQTP